ncbi:MAG TPA: hypothetical protein ENK82_09950, partial [Campylobacterales bacterium]|nr:hypothetical protein [Campylobacterales bacterium]
MNLKLVLFYIIAFIVLYTEPIQVGPVSFGILWKIIAVFLLTLPMLYESLKSKQMELFAVLYFAFAVKTLFNYTSFEYPMEAITIAVKIAMSPLLYLFFMKVPKETLLFIAKHYALAIILIFIPYHFGLIEPLGEGYNLSIYYLDGQFGLVGPFLSPHAASISLAMAMVIITLQINAKNSSILNLFYLSILVLGFYQLVMTYVRTGIAIYLTSLMYLYLQNFNFKKLLLMIITASLLIGIGAYLVSTSEVAKMRFEDRHKYAQHDGVGSGRLLYWSSAIKNWTNDEDIVLLVGLGYTYGRQKMKES